MCVCWHLVHSGDPIRTTVIYLFPFLSFCFVFPVYVKLTLCFCILFACYLRATFESEWRSLEDEDVLLKNIARKFSVVIFKGTKGNGDNLKELCSILIHFQRIGIAVLYYMYALDIASNFHPNNDNILEVVCTHS